MSAGIIHLEIKTNYSLDKITVERITGWVKDVTVGKCDDIHTRV